LGENASVRHPRQESALEFNGEKKWSTTNSADLYGVNRWGQGYFGISPAGNLSLEFESSQSGTVQVDSSVILQGLRQRGLTMPVMLRLDNIAEDRVRKLYDSFARAIAEASYQNSYRGVFPIKVNQQAHIVEGLANVGEEFSHGFEAGSKAELLVAMTHLKSKDSLIVCNGYKDKEFIDLGFQSRLLGFKCFFVIETLQEVPLIIEQAKKWKVRPMIGLRVKLATQVDGHWANDSGDRSLFGLSTIQMIELVDQLREAEMLDCLQMLHFHLGSQIPNIRNIRDGVAEACRFYADLVNEGAAMGYLDVGGGLAVDYDGSESTEAHSRNYDVNEYCIDVVETIATSLNLAGVAHPILISESGRWTVAPMSVLIFNVMEVNRFAPRPLLESYPDDIHESVDCLLNTLQHIHSRRLQENYNDAIYYLDQAREAFQNGSVSLRERALAENICLTILHEIAAIVPEMKRPPATLLNLDDALSDIYYGNFSVFQSLPDSWAINQVFPVMPIQRLHEEPTRNAIIGDLTCDCDGKLDRFAGSESNGRTLKLHEIAEGEEYCIGVFLTGAYQETLGDLHNLFGDANVASVRVDDNGDLQFVHELAGDSISDVLSYVEYRPDEIVQRFESIADAGVANGSICGDQREKMIELFNESMSGYTYFEN
jgi:arginine decarboxylase